MVSLTRTESKAARFVKDLDIDDLHDQLDTLRAYVHELIAQRGQKREPPVRPRPQCRRRGGA